MIFVFYGSIALGASLLVLDLRGVLRVAPAPLQGCRLIASLAVLLLAVASVATLAYVAPGGPSLLLIVVIATYLIGGGLYLTTLFVERGHRSDRIRRLAYASLLVVGLIPSFVLLALAPATALAGLGLVRPRGPDPVPDGRAVRLSHPRTAKCRRPRLDGSGGPSEGSLSTVPGER